MIDLVDEPQHESNSCPESIIVWDSMYRHLIVHGFKLGDRIPPVGYMYTFPEKQ